ncbi:hypothetical protein JI745_06160 [Piscinibacter sp. HJYY11]|nr:hypothetical protein [Piscinibacter sp. HJYY11]
MAARAARIAAVQRWRLAEARSSSQPPRADAADALQIPRRAHAPLQAPRHHHGVRALNVLNGAVLVSCKARHLHQEVLSFPREIDEAVPIEPGVR